MTGDAPTLFDLEPLMPYLDALHKQLGELAAVTDTSGRFRCIIDIVKPDGSNRRLTGYATEWGIAADGKQSFTFHPDVTDVELPDVPTERLSPRYGQPDDDPVAVLKDATRRLDQARTRARSTDPETSHEAAAAVAPKLRESQEAVLAIFRLNSDDREGITDDDLVALAELAGVRQSQSGLRTRRAELVRDGLLRDSGHRRVNHNGRRAIVWELTE